MTNVQPPTQIVVYGIEVQFLPHGVAIRTDEKQGKLILKYLVDEGLVKTDHTAEFGEDAPFT